MALPRSLLYWPSRTHCSHSTLLSDEAEQELACLVSTDQPTGLVDFERYSKYGYLKRVVAWIVRFIHNST